MNGTKWQIVQAIITGLLTLLIGLVAWIVESKHQEMQQLRDMVNADRQKNASYQRQVDVNTHRIDRLEDRVFRTQ